MAFAPRWRAYRGQTQHRGTEEEEEEEIRWRYQVAAHCRCARDRRLDMLTRSAFSGMFAPYNIMEGDYQLAPF